MIRYPADYNPILKYWAKIQSGEEVVSSKVEKTYRKLVYDIEHPDKWHFSTKRANHVIEFAENFCRFSKGKSGGQKVVLELWEKAMLAAIFGFIDGKGIRKYQRAILIVAKKNGKSLLASIVALYMLCADGEPGPECYSVATKKDQAKIIWEESKKMVKKSSYLLDKITPLVGELRCDFCEGTFKPLSSDSNSLDGLNVHCVLMDEFHQWRNGRALYDIMADGITARENPLIFMTSTAGVVREDIYDNIYDECKMIIDGYFTEDGYQDERTIAFVYELDKREFWTDPSKWKQANPGLGTIKNLTTLTEKVEKAQQNPTHVKNLLTKEFNIAETSAESWLTAEEAVNKELFDITKLMPKYGIGGCDLSRTNDLTAAKVIFKVPSSEKLYVLQMYWMPEDLVDKHVKEDKVPYDIWIERGYVRTCPGNKIDYHMVTAWFKEIQDTYDIYLYKVGYDSWSAPYWVDEMKDTLGESVMIPVKQGKQTLSDPMYLIRADLGKKLVVYNDNPVDRWCLFNTAVDVDINNNIQPHKTSSPTRRIDGVAALLDAYVVYVNNQEEYLSLI